ncbi:MAG: hypothetical protein [Circular genetic element sp.]|nr:MAG: hypothetical protein [Circular genetic element sp.]
MRTKRYNRRRPRRKRMRRRKRATRIPNMISLPGGLLPPRAMCKHKYSREIRLSEPYTLSPISNTDGSIGVPCALCASCNSIQAPLNERGIGGNNESTPAFLPLITNVGEASTGVLWDSGREPNLYPFLSRQYQQYTVVGSKFRFNYKPFTVRDGTVAPSEAAFTFILVKRQTTSLIGSNGLPTFPSPNNYPQEVEQQPGSKVIDWTSVDNWTRKNGVTMTMGFSAKRSFGKAKGNVVGESNLQGSASNPFSTSLAASSVQEQTYWQLYILPKVGADGQSIAVDTKIPPGIITVDIEYNTIWTERRTLPQVDA